MIMAEFTFDEAQQSMASKPPITIGTKDKKSYYPEQRLVGRLFLHTGNKRLYRIVGFVWHGNNDEWHIKYVHHNGNNTEYTRTPDNFFGKRVADEDRFIKIEDLPQDDD